MKHPESLHEHAGGEAAVHRIEEIVYEKVLADPRLKEQFSERRPTHVDHLTWFNAESFGGPDRITRELGFQHIIDVHRHLRITDDQRARFVALYLEALDEAGLPNDELFREAVPEHIEFGSHVAQQNAWAETDADLHPIRSVPRWEWPDPAAASQNSRRPATSVDRTEKAEAPARLSLAAPFSYYRAGSSGLCSTPLGGRSPRTFGTSRCLLLRAA